MKIMPLLQRIWKRLKGTLGNVTKSITGKKRLWRIPIFFTGICRGSFKTLRRNTKGTTHILRFKKINMNELSNATSKKWKLFFPKNSHLAKKYIFIYQSIKYIIQSQVFLKHYHPPSLQRAVGYQNSSFFSGFLW